MEAVHALDSTHWVSSIAALKAIDCGFEVHRLQHLRSLTTTMKVIVVSKVIAALKVFDCRFEGHCRIEGHRLWFEGH